MKVNVIALVSVLLPLIVSGIVSLAVAWVTLHGALKRDRESDWRKVKLDLYLDYILAVSGMTEDRANRDAQLKYLDAAHSLMLFSPPDVVKILIDFNNNKLDSKYLTPLFKAIRKDINYDVGNLDDDLSFKLFQFVSKQNES